MFLTPLFWKRLVRDRTLPLILHDPFSTALSTFRPWGAIAACKIHVKKIYSTLKPSLRTVFVMIYLSCAKIFSSRNCPPLRCNINEAHIYKNYDHGKGSVNLKLPCLFEHNIAEVCTTTKAGTDSYDIYELNQIVMKIQRGT